MNTRRLLGVCLAALTVSFLVFPYVRTRSRSDGSRSDSPVPPVPEAKAENLKRTQIPAHLRVPIQRGTNVLCCGTFQLAWSEALNAFGEKLRFREPVPLAEFLNTTNFTRGDVDEPGCVAAGGPRNSETVGRIRAEARQKSGHDFKLDLLDKATPPAMPALLFYAGLFKNLGFKQVFQESEHPLQQRTGGGVWDRENSRPRA